MKIRKFILIAAISLTLAGCAGGSPAGSALTPPATTSPPPTQQPVPDVVGKTYLAARTALNELDYIARVVGKDGKSWTVNIVPDESVVAVSMNPVAGSTPESSTVHITVNVTEEEFKAASAARKEAARIAAEEAKIATRYTYTCGSWSSSQPTYKNYREVWVSGDYKNGGRCYIEIDGKNSHDKVPLLLSEQKLVDLVAAKGGEVSAPSSTVGDVMLLCAKIDSDYADQIYTQPEWKKAKAAAALTVCPDAPHAAVLQEEVAAVKIGDGTKIVGQTMEPGSWKTKPGAKDCYWSRSTGGGKVIANDFVGFAPDGVTVTVYVGEGFESSRCGPWTKIG